jgi:hypothetical protein
MHQNGMSCSIGYKNIKLYLWCVWQGTKGRGGCKRPISPVCCALDPRQATPPPGLLQIWQSNSYGSIPLFVVFGPYYSRKLWMIMLEKRNWLIKWKTLDMGVKERCTWVTTEHSTSPFVEQVYERIKDTLNEYEVIISRWPEYTFALENVRKIVPFPSHSCVHEACFMHTYHAEHPVPH